MTSDRWEKKRGGEYELISDMNEYLCTVMRLGTGRWIVRDDGGRLTVEGERQWDTLVAAQEAASRYWSGVR